MEPNIHLKLEKNTAECRQILGVDSNSTPKEIKQAYRNLSLKYHPDRNTEFKDGKKFKEISEAYQVLKSNRKPYPRILDHVLSIWSIQQSNIKIIERGAHDFTPKAP